MPEMFVTDVNHENLAAVQSFLEAHAETALFLLSNLQTHGPTLGDSISSGNFKCVVDRKSLSIQTVFHTS